MRNLSKKLKGETLALLLAVVTFSIMNYVLMNVIINIKNEAPVFNGVEKNDIAFVLILNLITLIIYKVINPQAIKIKSSLKRTWMIIGISLVQIVILISGFFLITTGMISKITEGSDIYSALSVSLPEYLAVTYYAFLIAETKLIYASSKIINDSDGKAQRTDTFNTVFISTTICMLFDVFIVLLLYKLYPLRSENTFPNWLHSIYNYYSSNDHQFYNTFSHKSLTISLAMEALKLMCDIKILISCAVPLSFILIKPFFSSANEFKSLVASSVDEIKDLIKIYPINKVLKGYDSFAEETVEVYKLVPARRDELANDEDDFVNNPYEIIKRTCEANGINISFLKYDKPYSILKSTAIPILKSGNTITSYFISSKTGMFIPINNSKMPIQSRDVRIVTFIGSKGSAKSSTMQALTSMYTSDAPRYSIEHEYYQQLTDSLSQNKVPEATEETLLKSPSLFLRYNNQLLACFDVAGENSSLTALTNSAKRRVIVLMIDIDSERSLDDAIQYIKDIKQSKTKPKKIIICITKCDLISEADRLMNNNNPTKRTQAIINNYSSNSKFKALVEEAKLSEFSPCPVEAMFIASTGCEVDSNYNILGDYSPRYIDVLLDRIIK